MKTFRKTIALLLCLTLNAAPLVSNAQTLRQFSYRIPLTPNPVLVPPAAKLSFIPASIHLGGQAGTLSESTVTLKNSGNASSTVHELLLENAAPGLLVVDSCAGLTLAPAATCAFKVQFLAGSAGPTVGAAVSTNATAGGARLEVSTDSSPSRASAHIVSLTPSPATLHADGTAVSTISATVRDAYGNALGAGIPVLWSSSEGRLSQLETVTDEAGRARVVLTASKVLGIHSVFGKTKTMDTPVSGSVEFVTDKTSGAVIALIPASSSSLIGDTISTQASVKDSAGHLLPGVPVYFTTSHGTLSSALSVTDATGIATTSVSSQAAGLARIRAYTAERPDAQIAADIDFRDPAVSKLDVASDSIIADGTSRTALTATVADTSGKPVGAGTVIQWATDFGTLSPASSVTDSAGKAVTQLTSRAQVVTATVTARAALGAATGKSVSVRFIPDEASSKVATLSASPASITATAKSTSTLSATVTDSRGNLVGAGVAVQWSATSGILSKAETLTDARGQAQVVLTSATTLGSSTVSAATAASPASVTTTVAFVEDLESAVVTSLVPLAATSGIGQVVTAQATVKDSVGHLLSGVTVKFSASAGTLSSYSAVSNDRGIATTSVSSNTAGGSRLPRPLPPTLQPPQQARSHSLHQKLRA